MYAHLYVHLIYIHDINADMHQYANMYSIQLVHSNHYCCLPLLIVTVRGGEELADASFHYLSTLLGVRPWSWDQLAKDPAYSENYTCI